MQRMTFKKNNKLNGRWILVILVLLAFMTIGLFLGGITFSLQVFKNLMVGVAIGAFLKIILIIFVKAKKGKKLLRKRG